MNIRPLALGKWTDTEATFWIPLVERRGSNHLGASLSPEDAIYRQLIKKGITPEQMSIRNDLALGDDVFAGVSDVPAPEQIAEIVRRTRSYIMADGTQRILFDATRVSGFGKMSPREGGYFARQELMIILEDPRLMAKTQFFSDGSRMWSDRLRFLLGDERIRERLRRELGK